MSDFVIEKGILKKYTGTQKLVTIPGDVKCIGEKAFYGCSQLEHVDVPEGVTEIQSYAFLECTGLHSVSLPKSLRKIWGGAFRECSSLEHVDSPDGLPQASAMLFFKCSSLKKVQLSNRVTCIENDAFADCTSLEDISIPARVTEIDMHAFQGCSALRSVKLPCGVTTIRLAAFKGCTQLDEILIPSSAISIEEDAFADTAWIKRKNDLVIVNDIAIRYTGNAENIVVPQGVKKIGAKAFAGCYHVKSISMPESLVSIEQYAFHSCKSLENIVIPQGTTRLGKAVFEGCSNLHSIEIPSSVSEIDGELLGKCEHLRHLTVYGTPDFLDTWFSYSIFPHSLDMEWMCFPDVRNIPPVKAQFKMLFLQGFLKHPELYNEAAKLSYHNYMSQQRKRLLNEAVNNNDVSLFAGYEQEAVEISPVLRDELINLATHGGKTEVLAWLLDYQNRTADSAPAINSNAFSGDQDSTEQKGAQSNRKPSQKTVTAPQLQPQQTDNPHDAFIVECINNYSYAEEAVAAIKPNTKVHRKGGNALASLAELRYILSEFVRLYHKCKYTTGSAMGTVDKLSFGTVVAYQITPEIIRIAEQLDRRELDALLSNLAHGTKYRTFILAYGALATGDEVKLIADEIVRKGKGTAKERYWAEHMEYALYLNSEHEAMLFFDKIGELGSYAKWRFHTTEQLLRDTYMMPQFDFDADGTKRYDIGGNIIEVSITPDLSCQLYDTKNKKILRSMPKKSDDPEKAAACAADFAVFKKSIKDFYSQRMKNMHRLHIDGTTIDADSWRRVYIDHPVVKLAARLLVWQDEKGKTFTPTANGIIGINGEVYEPVGKIQLAHVLSLSPEEVSAWQDYYANNHLQQPFAQVWEPVIPWNQEQAVTRYKNKLLTRANRNALKKALEFAGISMRSEVEDLGYNYREGKHEFANHGQLHFDQFFSLDFELYDGDLLLGDGHVAIGRRKPSATVLRGMNAVFSQLDFAIARDAAAETSEAELVKLDLTHFTLAQINELINIATANKSTACTAYLLNLKNERFPQYNALDHLVLDW